jgi:hypothetical protein
MSIRNNRRTLWSFLITMEVMNYGEANEVEKSLLKEGTVILPVIMVKPL